MPLLFVLLITVLKKENSNWVNLEMELAPLSDLWIKQQVERSSEKLYKMEEFYRQRGQKKEVSG